MNARSWKWLPPFGATSLLLLLTYLLVRGAAPDVALHQQTVDVLRSVVFQEAALQRDVLKARAGLLRNYDPLAQAMDHLREAMASLTTAILAIDGAEGTDLGRLRERLTAAAAAQEDLVETFKSKNALLQNSLSYFRLVSRRLSVRIDDKRDAVAVEIAALANAMLSFTGEPGQENAAVLTSALGRLARLQAPSSLAVDLHGLVAHGRLTVATLPEVDEVLGRILAASTSAQARRLEAAYLAHHGRAEAHAKVFRVLLYLASLLLLAYLSYLFLRLRANARILEARLRFERLIGRISARLVELPHDCGDEAVREGLARLGQHLDVDRAYALWRGDQAHDGERILEWQREGCPDPLDGLHDLPALAAGAELEKYERHGCLLVPRVAALTADRLRAFLADRGVQSWLGVPLWHAGRRVGLLGFEAVQQELDWLAADTALLRTAGEILSGVLERERAAVERETLVARLRRAERMETVGTLAGGIAHDFNNILGAILGYTEMALSALPSSGDASRYLRQVMLAGERARGLVDQILVFSRSGDGRERLPVCARAVIEEAVTLLRASLPATTALRLHLEAGDATVLGDAGRLQQVVINLCTNAAHAMEGRGVVEIALDTVETARDRVLSHGTLAPGRYVRLIVSDSGRGMDPATVERAFEPFFTTKPAGTGLGLASVHGIVAEHGGALNVRSRPDDGSTFEAYFSRTAETIEITRDKTQPLARGAGEAILLVDDERSLVLLGEEMLAALGYEPVGFDSAAKALEAIRADPMRFDLVLADEIMPEMTGTELAVAVRKIRPELPILLMTGYPGPARPYRLHAAGIREVLRKPLLLYRTAEALARELRRGA